MARRISGDLSKTGTYSRWSINLILLASWRSSNVKQYNNNKSLFHQIKLIYYKEYNIKETPNSTGVYYHGIHYNTDTWGKRYTHVSVLYITIILTRGKVYTIILTHKLHYWGRVFKMFRMNSIKSQASI